MTTLVWFRDDLRLSDHAALHAAAESGDDIVALFVLEDESAHVRALGGAAAWWLHHSLTALRAALAERDVPLILRRGAAEQIVPEVVRESGASRVLWNRRYGQARHHDAALKIALRETGCDVGSFAGDVLFEPWTIATQDGGAYKVYSAFWRACTAAPAPALPLPAPSVLVAAATQPRSENLDSWELLPTAPDWAGGLAERWTPGEASAQRTLDEFLEERLAHYGERDYPAEQNCSELSPHLRWGEISPRTVWHRTLRATGDVGLFLSELGWREFAKHTAFHVGPLHRENINRRFDGFPWRTDGDDALSAWQQGRTGFGLVDAGMRELWQTGVMHNRVRMVTASFLTKNLLLDWRIGEAWFWDTLVDADEASNPFNWQWVAGCGADAAPYFRVFNPELQQKKFDPEGRYVALWAPDSAMLPPIVDLRATRAQALEAYHSLPR
ncbi:deoxyribodipyrimidine photo-lyase [Microbacterium keratanolyticum]|uniref:Deoxyribodipyrimidine photo-lyase n=1 Tax=Microbacterium keratanolyticum TaxID=67574 RepID=A0A9W6HTL7_9MICO|nr:deoxyribodipyrimidine photo-lyase [Microbacterium keratanolyticum]MBM7469707.1 deoxyribodipyrimidine photo-lyase [Microbacterium keratanolyticum]GLK01785.1 deoxyribodipyrimidine photo-lyase [Microbacterium keratanolyticum]